MSDRGLINRCVICREGAVCILRKTWIEGRQIIKMDYPVVGLSLLPIDQTIILVCMNKELDCFSKKGKRLWTVELPQSAMCMESIHLTHLSQTLVAVALRGGLVQIYSQKNLVDQFTTQGIYVNIIIIMIFIYYVLSYYR